jgi:tetratricopeptide (TPR) repeat protein/CHAT domain-containing protein
MKLPLDLIERLSEVSLDAPLPGVLEKNPQLREKAVILEIADQVNRIAREDLARAERLANLLAWLSEVVADDFCRARVLRCLGNIRVMRTDYQKAIGYFEDALSSFQRLGSAVEEAATLSSLLQPLIYLGKYPEAFAKAQRAKDIASSLADDLLLARVNINFGNILHRLDRFSEAVTSYKTALPVLERCGELQDCAIAHLNLAVCYISLNDFSAAEDAYRQARFLSRQEKMPAIVAQADYNIAYLHYCRGEYPRAMELYQQTRRYCETCADHFHSALCDLDQAEIYLDLHLHAEAVELATDAQHAFQRMKMPYEAAKAMIWLAIAAYQSRRPFRALELLATAQEQMKSEGNTPWTTLLDLYQGTIMRHEGRYYEALRYCDRARPAFVDGSPRAVHAHLLLSTLQIDIGRETEAQLTLEHALAAARKLQSPQLLSRAYMLLGRCQKLQKRLCDAATSYRKSIAYREKVPIQAHAEGFKIPLSKDKLEIYTALLNLGTRGPARMPAREILQIVEKSRSREIAEVIASRANSLKSPCRNKSTLVEQLRGLRQELSWYYRKSEDVEFSGRETAALEAQRLRESIRIREDSVVNTLNAMRETDAEFHALQAASTTPIQKVQCNLKNEEVILEFFDTGGAIYVCLLSCATCEVVLLTSTALLREHIRRLQGRLSLHPYEAKHLPSKDKVLIILKDMYEALIRPIQDRISGLRLIVSPDSILRYLPFHALFDGRDFLIQKHLMSYTGSATLHYLGSMRAAGEPGRDVFVQPKEDEESKTTFLKGFLKVYTTDGLHVLDATNRHVHLSCKFWSRLDNPIFSKIKIGDTQTTNLDLFNLDLSCSALGVGGVGVGVRADGDGVEFEVLARGFEYAGARTLVLPLWNSSVEVNHLFFENFYKAISVNGDAAVGFQTALKKVQQDFASPLCWAPFILRGQTRSYSVTRRPAGFDIEMQSRNSV